MHEASLFTVIPSKRPISVAFYDAIYWGHILVLKPQGPHGDAF